MNNNKFYLNEFEVYDGECFITLTIIDVNFDKNIITVAVTNRGKISVVEFDLFEDEEGYLCFEYGIDRKQIRIEDFMNYEILGEF